MLDLYCERRGPGLFAEPINASTNLAFLVAALAAWLLARRLGALSSGVATLITLAVAVGIGSGLFHTFATPWASVLDLAPIFAFQVVFLWLYLRQCVGLSTAASTAIAAGYFVICLLMKGVPPLLNGSILYAPSFLVLGGLAAYHYLSGQRERWLLVVALIVFFAALVFRSLDELACPYVPFGTHFLWHILNGGLLYLAMRALIQDRAAAADFGMAQSSPNPPPTRPL